MITRIEATRYRCFAKLDVELGDFRVLVGARQDRAAAVVIDPELEVLLWQNNPHVERALRHSRPPLRRLLEKNGRWPPDAPKPPAPKEGIQALIHANRARPPMVGYCQIARTVSTAGCVDPAFHRLRDTLRAWFPAEGT